MVTVKIDLDAAEYAKALTKKGAKTWRRVLLDGLGIAHDARTMGRPHAFDNIYKDQSAPSKSGGLDKLYTGLDERQKEHRGG